MTNTEVITKEIEHAEVVIQIQKKTEEIEGTVFEKTTKIISIEMDKECKEENYIYEVQVKGIDKCEELDKLQIIIRGEVQNKKNNG